MRFTGNFYKMMNTKINLEKQNQIQTKYSNPNLV